MNQWNGSELSPSPICTGKLFILIDLYMTNERVSVALSMGLPGNGAGYRRAWGQERAQSRPNFPAGTPAQPALLTFWLRQLLEAGVVPQGGEGWIFGGKSNPSIMSFAGALKGFKGCR